MNFGFSKLLRISLLPLAILQGCALTDAHIDLAYLPVAEGKSPLGTIRPLQVALQVEDQRPADERRWVGNKRNGFGMVTAWVRSNKEVTSVVYDGLKSELVNNGHKVVDVKEIPSDVGILVRLKRYWSDISIRFWDVEVTGTLNADINVRDLRKSETSLSKPIQSAFREGYAIATDAAHESVLNGALREFIRNFARDPEILRALKDTVKNEAKLSTPPS